MSTHVLIQVEGCGCITHTANGALVRPCRRHDPDVARRVVEALEEEVRRTWRDLVPLRRAVRLLESKHYRVPQGALDTLAENEELVRTLLRIRRAGRRT